MRGPGTLSLHPGADTGAGRGVPGAERGPAVARAPPALPNDSRSPFHAAHSAAMLHALSTLFLLPLGQHHHQPGRYALLASLWCRRQRVEARYEPPCFT